MAMATMSVDSLPVSGQVPSPICGIWTPETPVPVSMRFGTDVVTMLLYPVEFLPWYQAVPAGYKRWHISVVPIVSGPWTPAWHYWGSPPTAATQVMFPGRNLGPQPSLPSPVPVPGLELGRCGALQPVPLGLFVVVWWHHTTGSAAPVGPHLEDHVPWDRNGPHAGCQ